MEKLKFLVVDDDRDCNELVRLMLESIDIVTEPAFSGPEALQKLEREHFDALFLDIKMPQMNGYEVAQHLRAEKKSNIPIVALTAFTMPADVEKCFEAGFDIVEFKPVELKVLQNLVLTNLVHLIRQRQSQPEICSESTI